MLINEYKVLADRFPKTFPDRR